MRGLAAVLCLAATALALPARSEALAWVPTNLSGVDVVALQADPRDPLRVWAGGSEGRVFVSTDGGVSFAPVPVDLPATRISNLAVGPGAPSRLYASTDQGLFRLEGDGTWSRLRPHSGWGGDDRVAVDPSAPGTIVVSTGRDRLERSTDGGSTWAVAWEGTDSYWIWSIAFDPSGSGVVLAAEGRQEYDYRLLRSTDHGATWTALRSNALDFLVFDPFGSGTVYADQFSYFDKVPTHVRSRDAGVTWEPFAPSSQDAYGSLAVLQSGAVVAAGSGGVFRTDGKGSPWISAAGGAPGGEPGPLVALDPDGTTLLLGTARSRPGLFRTVRAPDPVPLPTFLPVVVDAFGERGTRFRTSVALFNASDGMAEGTLTYVAAGSVGATGAGTVPLRLRAGQQRDFDDLTDYLRKVGLEIPQPTAAQPQVGTLTARTSDGLCAGAVVALVRVTTPSGPGVCGTGLWSLPATGLSSGQTYLSGLRENPDERTNVAVANAGDTGTIRMRGTFFVEGGSVVKEAELEPGQWVQWNAPLAGTGSEVADAVVERIDGTEPYSAYATIVDGVTGDGSYLPARGFPAEGPQWIPAVVESGGFETEVVLYNPGELALRASLFFTDSLDPFASSQAPLAPLVVSLPPRRSVAIPRFVEALRSAGIAVGPRGVSHAGTLLVGANEAGGVPRPVLAWARTSIPAATGGSYGVAYTSLAAGDLALTEAWIAGVATDYAGSRANLALINPGSDPLKLEWRAFANQSGWFDTGFRGTVELGPGGWHQESLDLSRLGTNITVRVRKVAGKGPFAAYGVVNDGAKPGLGTGDGSYLPMVAVR